MKNLKNTFLILVICAICAIIVFQVYIAYSYNNVDTNSYIKLIEGKGTLNQSFLDTGVKNVVLAGDQIRVIGDSSFAVIEWGDGSITRLWGNSKIHIEQNTISKDRTYIHIDFELIAGKTWSNVVSFIGKDSSFVQRFDTIEAGVRGTVFDVDMTKKFIHVSAHEVLVKNTSWETEILSSNTPFDFNTFSFIDIEEFVNQLQNNTWKNMNTQFDAQYISQLTDNLQQSTKDVNPFFLFMEKILPHYRIIYELDTTNDYASVAQLIENMSAKKRQKVYQKVESRYQTLNFVSPSQQDLFTRKMYYKQALLDLAESPEEKENLLISTMYDLQDSMITENSSAITETLTILAKNTQYLWNIHLTSIFSVEDIPDVFFDEIEENFHNLKEAFNIDYIKKIRIDSAKDILDNADDVIHNTLDTTFWDLLDTLK